LRSLFKTLACFFRTSADPFSRKLLNIVYFLARQKQFCGQVVTNHRDEVKAKDQMYVGKVTNVFVLIIVAQFDLFSSCAESFVLMLCIG